MSKHNVKQNPTQSGGTKKDNSAKKQPAANPVQKAGAGQSKTTQRKRRNSSGPVLQTPKKVRATIPPSTQMATKYKPSGNSSNKQLVQQAFKPASKAAKAAPTPAQINRALASHAMAMRKVSAFRKTYSKPLNEKPTYPELGFGRPRKASSSDGSEVARAAFAPSSRGVPSSLKQYPGFAGFHSSDPRIPRSASTHPLSASRTPGGHSGQIQNRLKKKSPWYSSIMDPLHGADCKIPDATGEETGTIQIVERAIVVTNAHGFAAFRIITPYINLALYTPTESVNYQVHTPTATASETAVAFGDGVNTGYNYGFPFDGAADITGVTNAHRVVSASLTVEHEASGLNNQGEMCLASIPWQAADSPLYADHMNLYNAVQVPLNQNKPACTRWFPINRQAYNYDAFQYTNLGDIGVPDEPDSSVPLWTMEFLASGCAVGVTFRLTMVVNYEFLPIFNTLNVLSISPSPVDMEEEELVAGWVETMPVVNSPSDKVVNSSPGTVSPQHGDEPTGFGMIANVISEIIPFVSLLL